MDHFQQLIRLLSNGKSHSGELLGESLGITRSAVSKILQQCKKLRIPLESLSGRGYCIHGGLELFDEQIILADLSPEIRDRLSTLTFLFTVPSTNEYLLAQAKQQMLDRTVCFAEHQSAGRGRNNRSWVSPFGSNIYTSLAWVFPNGAASLAGLSLVVGVAVVKALQAYGIQDIHLKWPNDIQINQHKLGGILVDVFGDSVGPCQTIIGIGLNLDLPKQHTGTIDQPWTDLNSETGVRPSKNKIAALLIEHLLQAMSTFQASGFAAFLPEWLRLDALTGESVTVTTAQGQLTGIAQGVNMLGQLQIESSGITHTFHSAEVSVRRCKQKLVGE